MSRIADSIAASDPYTMVQAEVALAVALVVDDSRVGRMIVARIVRGAGWDVVEADGGSAALDVLASGSPDIVFLDLHMPEMPGQDVIRAIRERGIRVPIVVLTADLREETRLECERLGVAGFINKPVKPTAVAELLDRVPEVRA